MPYHCAATQAKGSQALLREQGAMHREASAPALPTVLGDVLKGKVHEAAAAAGVLLGVAVHQLLLAQAHQLAGADGVDALHRAHGREGPAGAALQRGTQGASGARM